MSTTTPIVDFVRRYAQSGTSRLHMPGHKGQRLLGFEPWDITEIKGADELYGADGIIAQSEANATRLFAPILEYSYKNDDLHDPFINHYYALALDLATQEELDTIAKYAFKVNEVLKKIMLDANIRLIDFKLEFGRLSDGTIILADEISPDTCRFWDATTGAHLDKDLFRRSLGGEADAYQEVMKRLLGG